ncbi:MULTISPECIES: sensor histidine kinase [Paenibacillus]|jgi:two-component system sensor histidine kinase VanS|uniref:histidine kinase n=1 Tax=Paenibacillus polymyxa TaxID=1406 RepID=A0A378XPQ4_PAEPO|nr:MULTISPECIES: HAMP domain-containing sensor histidine kinase [Paenibacillus]AUS24892.1 histidine kinase [Paenibacillus polymyxa]KAE8560202.1 two-component sensor histidine kinase [Paenibacillus polymyxa]KAF6615164.1 HAMP domain-containing protein [Paenibacillus sp. EKM101P]KAF6618766.1 HAMP domain-containing protein [Paenibacillus sp. EKM102P]KAF6627213.1 HAMP domain-containing protein [Paenibacillus sp. EKM10P]
MNKRGVTFKLFIMTVVFFLCFYGMVILSQLLFFENFYQKQKIGRVESRLQSFGQSYVQEAWGSGRVSREAARFMLQNKNQLAIVTLDGKVKLDDAFHINLRKADGKIVKISLSLFMSEYGDELRAARIQPGDTVTVEGEVLGTDGISSAYLIYPSGIQKLGFKNIGSISDETSTDDSVRLSGTVTEIVLPDLKTWSQRQGLLYSALEEWFPLSQDHLEKLKNFEVLEEEWTEPWTGVRNAVIVHPVRQSTGEIDLLFTVTSLQEISETNEALRWFYLYLGIGGFALILILSLFYSRMVTRPLITLNNTAKRMAKLDFTAHTPIRQNDELGSLSYSMYTLSQNLDTALRELQEANQQLVEDMEQKQRMEAVQQDFFANASHELKTPLSIIKGFAEGLQDGVSAGKQDHYMKVIVEEADKMERLVKDMLDLAKLESGTLKLRKTTFILSELVEEVVDKLFHLLKEKQLEVVIIPANELPIHADIGWMEQVIINFVVNAIRHAEEGSSITIRIEGSGEVNTFSIENKGETIPDDQLELIWNRFYRAELSRSRQTGGTGLGLSIVKRILDLHEFRYMAENTKDGVRFVVIFGG